MGWIVSMFLAFAICGGVFFVGRTTRRDSTPGSPGAFRGVVMMGAAGVLLGLWVVIHTMLVSVKTVEAGHVGIVYRFGSIVGQRSEGLQFIPPWETMTTASVQVQRQRFEGISGFSKETQEVIITATLNYSVAPGAVQNLYRTVGSNWFNVLIEARINNFFKEETVKYDATAVAPSRELIRTAVKNRLAQDMDQYSVTIHDLLIDNLDFRPEFKQAIENKQIATQDALREGERVKQKQNEAQQAIETAKGAAESTRINAEGQAAANRLLSASLTPEVIQFQAVQKLSDKITIALVPSGQGVILDPTTLLSGGITKK